MRCFRVPNTVRDGNEDTHKNLEAEKISSPAEPPIFTKSNMEPKDEPVKFSPGSIPRRTVKTVYSKSRSVHFSNSNRGSMAQNFTNENQNLNSRANEDLQKSGQNKSQSNNEM